MSLKAGSVNNASSEAVAVKNIGLFGNLTKDAVKDVCRELIKFSQKSGTHILLEQKLADHLRLTEEERDRFLGDISQADLIVTLGGDGTLLHTIRNFHPIHAPVLAVNMGSLGFNTQVAPEKLYTLLQDVIEGRYSVQERLILEVNLLRRNKVVKQTYALNDAVLTKTVESRIIHCECRIDGMFAAHYPGDGVIVSTPTGSTAYNLSLGGPILHPSLQVLAVTALCPARNGLQPVVIPGDRTIELEWKVSKDREEAVLCVDGQETYPLEDGDKIVLRGADDTLRMIVNPEYHYFEVLSKKIGWGGKKD